MTTSTNDNTSVQSLTSATTSMTTTHADETAAATQASTSSSSTATTAATTTAEQRPTEEDEQVPLATPLQRSADGKTTDDYMKGGKVIVLFKATGNAPQLKQNKFKLQHTAKFHNVGDFLRKQLRYSNADALFLFVNCTFQPAPDEIVADLFRCFHNNGKLIVNYATTPAWG